MTINSIISFTQRCGLKIEGIVLEDIGHALLIRVTKASRKIHRDRTSVFPKNDMGDLKVVA